MNKDLQPIFSCALNCCGLTKLSTLLLLLLSWLSPDVLIDMEKQLSREIDLHATANFSSIPASQHQIGPAAEYLQRINIYDVQEQG